MSQAPLVSVIMTFLNTEKYIVEAIESVLDQTYTNWKLTLVDDGSTDESTTIALNYSSLYPDKVIYLEHTGHLNKGISVSRNLGIHNSSGKYVATIDADDVWLPNKLEQQVRIMESNPEIGMVYGDTKYWFGWTGKSDDVKKEFTLHEQMRDGALELNSTVNPPLLLTLALKSYIWTASMSNIMFRRELFDKIGDFEQNFRGMHEDQVFLAKVTLTTPVYVSDTCWDLYRQHPASCYNVAVQRGLWRSTELYYLEWLENHLSDYGSSNSELHRALQNRIWKYKYPKSYNFVMYVRNFFRRLFMKGKKIIGRAGIRTFEIM